MFCTRVAWVCLRLCKEEGSSPVSLELLRDMGLYEVPLSMSLLGFGMGTMLPNFHRCGIMLVLRAVFIMLVRNASPKWPCELLFFTLFYCLLDLSCGGCYLCYILVFCASLCWCIFLSCVLRV